MLRRSNWNAVTALSLVLVPILTSQPASARRDAEPRPLSDRMARRVNAFEIRQANRASHINQVNQTNSSANRANGITGSAACGCGGLPRNADLVRNARRIPSEMALDLNSAEKVISLPARLFKETPWITVEVGGVTRTFVEGAKVTAAEYVAVNQVSGEGVQALHLDDNGVANGGQFSLDMLRQPAFIRRLSDLVIPQNVVAMNDVSRGAVRVDGAISNYGQISGIIGGVNDRTGRILVDSLVNHAGGSITLGSTNSDSSFLENMAAGRIEGSRLIIDARQSVSNSGQILSFGDLTLSAPEITNHGLLAAAADLSLQASKVGNSGSMKAFGSLLQIESANQAQPLTIDAAGGSFVAAGKFIASTVNSLHLSGGNITAQLVKLIAPNGIVDVTAESIAGPVDVFAGISSVHVNRGDLNVNNVNVIGDPIFTNSTGNITLPLSITAPGAPVTAVAAGDIIGHANGTVINTSSATVHGGNVILLAGVANTTANGTTTVTGPSGLSGSIYGIKSIDSSGSDTDSAGDITIGAFGGSVSVFGPILAGGRNGGEIRVMAPNGINLGNVESPGTHSNKDYITLATVNPALGSGLSFDSAGRLLSGSVGLSSTLGTGSIVTGNLDAGNRGNKGQNAGDISILAGGSVTTGYIRAMGGGAGPKGKRLFGYDYSNNGGSGGIVEVIAKTGAIFVDGDINTSGGGGGGSCWNVGGRGGDGGDVLLTAASDVILNGPLLAPGGGGGGGVGISSTDTGGGGGSLGNGGGPDSGGIFYSPPPYDGPAYLDNGLNLHNPNNPPFPYAGMGGSNTAYDIGCCGSGYGGNVGEPGKNGNQGTFAPRGWWNDTSPFPGGAPGLGGNITVTGRDIKVNKTIATFYDKEDIDKSPYADYSVFTHSSRGGGTITFQTASGSVSNTNFGSNVDLESTTASITAALRPGELSLAGKMRGDDVTLNGAALAKISNAGSYAGSGIGKLAIIENGATKVITNGNLVTPAEWIALIQAATTGSQDLVLGSGGAATAGSVNVASSNLPVSQLVNFVIPTSVTANITGQALSAQTAKINGVVKFVSDGVLTGNNVTVKGELLASDSLTINSPLLNLYSGSRISAKSVLVQSASALTLNVASGPLAAVIESTGGDTTLKSLGQNQNVSFSNGAGGAAAIDFKGGKLQIAGGNFSNAANLTVSAYNDASFNLSGTQFNNLGAIKVKDSLGGAGKLAINSTSTSTFTLNGGNLSVAPGGSGGDGGSFDIWTGNASLTLSASSLDASGLGTGDRDGGKISIVARNLVASGSPVSLLANASGTGKGGEISVITTASDSDINVGSGGQLLLSLHGGSAGSNSGDGGKALISAGRNLTVQAADIDAGPKGNSGAGAHIELIAGGAGKGDLLVTGALSANGIGNGAGGELVLKSNSSTVFNLGNAGSNGAGGALAANSGSSAGKAGRISISNAGTGGIAIDNTNLLSLIAHDDGGALEINAGQGALNLAPGSYSADGGQNGDGGILSLVAKQFAFGAGGVLLSANGTGNASGGTIAVTATGIAQNLSLGSSTMTMSATGGATQGHGGAIAVSSTGNLTLEAGSFKAGPTGSTGDGADYSFLAGQGGSGKLVVKDSLNASAKGSGIGGGIALGFADSANFVVGGTNLTNGVFGSVLANGAGPGKAGEVSVSNTSALNMLVTSSVSSSKTTLKSNDTIDVDVTGSLTGLLAATAKGVDINNTTGGLEIGQIDAGAGGVRLVSNGLTTVIGAVDSKGAITLESGGPLNIKAPLSASTSIALTTKGASSIFFDNGWLKAASVSIKTDAGDVTSSSASDVLTANTAVIESNSGDIGSQSNPLSLSTSSLSVNTGGDGEVYINSNGAGLLELLDSSSGDEFNLTAKSSVNIHDIHTAGGEISVKTSLGNLYVTPGSNLLAIDGDVNLQNDDLLGGTIAIGKDATIKGSSTIAGLGDVYIGFGSLASKLPKARKKLKDITINATNGGGMIVSRGRINPVAGGNHLIAEGRNIIFQNPTRKKARSIVLEGGVTIIADPPATASFALSAPMQPGLSDSAIVPDVFTESSNRGRQSSVSNLLSPPPSDVLGIDSGAAFHLQEIQTTPLTNARLFDENRLALTAPAVLEQSSFSTRSDDEQQADGRVRIWSQKQLIDDGGKLLARLGKSNEGGSIELNQGAVLFAPTADTVINIQGMKLHMAARSVALVVSFENGVSVYDIDDRHKGSVVLERHGEKVSLSPGHHVTVSHKTIDSFNDINPIAAIPHRSVKKSTLKDKHLYASEFSLISAIQGLEPLKQVMQSRNSQSKEISSNLLKTVAVVMQLRGASDFETYTRPELAAWSQ